MARPRNCSSAAPSLSCGHQPHYHHHHKVVNIIVIISVITVPSLITISLQVPTLDTFIDSDVMPSNVSHLYINISQVHNAPHDMLETVQGIRVLH